MNEDCNSPCLFDYYTFCDDIILMATFVKVKEFYINDDYFLAAKIFRNTFGEPE